MVTSPLFSTECWHRFWTCFCILWLLVLCSKASAQYTWSVFSYNGDLYMCQLLAGQPKLNLRVGGGGCIESIFRCSDWKELLGPQFSHPHASVGRGISWKVTSVDPNGRAEFHEVRHRRGSIMAAPGYMTARSCI